MPIWGEPLHSCTCYTCTCQSPIHPSLLVSDVALGSQARRVHVADRDARLTSVEHHPRTNACKLAALTLAAVFIASPCTQLANNILITFTPSSNSCFICKRTYHFASSHSLNQVSSPQQWTRTSRTRPLRGCTARSSMSCPPTSSAAWGVASAEATWPTPSAPLPHQRSSSARTTRSEGARYRVAAGSKV